MRNVKPNVMKDLSGYLSPEQMLKIYNIAYGPRDKLLIRLLIVSGRRITEILGRKEYVNRNKNHPKEHLREVIYPAIEGLKPRNIDFDKGHIIFSILKKRKKHQAIKVIDNETMGMLKEYIHKNNIKPDDRVFPITRYRAFQIVREICTNAEIYKVGIKEPHPHHFRHSFSVNYVRTATHSGAIRQLQQHLEHADINQTAHYLQFSQKDQKEQIERMSKGIFKKDEKGKA